MSWQLANRRDALQLALWPTSVCAFILGAWVAMQPAALWPWPLTLFMSVLGLCAWIAALWRCAHNNAVNVVWCVAACLSASVAAFGWSHATGHVKLIGSLSPTDEGLDLPVTGVVATLPQRIDRGVRFGFTVEQCACSVAGQQIALAWYSDLRADMLQDVPAVVPGQRWQLTVRLKRRHGVVNPHGFDVELWMLEQGFAATGYVRPTRLSATPNQLLAQNTGGVFVQIERWRSLIRQRMFEHTENSPQLSVLQALTMGDQRAISQNDWTIYNAAGIGHLLSISGLHVTMLAALVGWLCLQLARLSPALVHRVPAPLVGWVCGWVAACSYAVIAGFAVPAQRTVIMLSVVIAGRFFARNAHPAHVLAGAALAVLIADPLSVLSPGAWFSFVAVAMLMLSSAWAEDVTSLDWKPRLRRAAVAQCAVTLGLIPWTILFFSQVSLISPLANAVAIPWVSFLVTPVALLGAALLWPLPAVGGWVLDLAALLMRALDGLLKPMAQWEWAVASFPEPSSAVFLLAAFGAIVAIAVQSRWRVIGVLCMLPLFLPSSDRPAENAWRVTFLDVGQGMAAVVQTHDHTLLFDAGPQYNAESDSGLRVIVPYLRATGIRQLDGMIVSHADNDHSGGALSIQKAIPVGWMASSLPLMHPARTGAAPHRDCHAGDSWQWQNLRFSLLHPPQEWLQQTNHKTNALSCVLHVSDGARSVLLTGDIEAPQEALLLATNAVALRADVLLVPHHGSKTSSTLSFIQAVKPSYAVFQNGYRNRFGHPASEVWNRFGDQQITRLRSDADGAVIFDFFPGAIGVKRTRLEQPRWWRTEVAPE